MTAAGGARQVDKRQATRDAVAADLGMSWAELAERARQQRFTSAKALTAWIIFGD